MTPKEKAEELFYKFKNEFNWIEKDYDVDLYRDAKQCALIAVDEIVRLDIFNCNWEWSDEDGDTREYWQEVKQEIEKL
jgi:hypothetical protein